MFKTAIIGSLILATVALPGKAQTEPALQDATHTIQHIRNATLKVTYGDTTFLVDPMLADKGAYPGFENTYRSDLRNPMVTLPMPVETLLKDVDAVIVTHTHLDHWDDAAQQHIAKDIPLFVQNTTDAGLIRSQGFTDVRVLSNEDSFSGVTLHKTGGQHGSDAIYSVPALAEILGNVMGVVFEASGYETTYIVGDTLWRSDVEHAIQQYQPGVIVLNTGAAEVTGFKDDPIIMGKQDTLRAHRAAPDATIVAVHMDAVNHMTVSRKELREYVEQEGIEKATKIPADGETLTFK
ncbi:MBL fold metallo-hydrolase [Salinimonas iocasae]|uniref:MBL fold metallo-hydrolase n=1 Tax=Salinimonas iocasae TaxID=2572577 RepID=A0A5B7YAX4_9ALTE|nr:MBL fold metallo-hydrolase [Salinimonas iocasae]QCZ92630.1 MBL fold metallo-hydrolase [Salinimonas iocasae]